MFEFRIRLNDNDYLLFNQYHLLNSPSGKKTLLYFNLIIPFSSFIFILLFGINKGSDFLLILTQVILLAILSIIWAMFSKKIALKFMASGIKKMKKEGKLPYSNELILRFDNENIHEITSNTENKVKYSMIEKIAVTDKAIYIYFSSVQAYILPLTAFSDEMEKAKFLEFINWKAS